MVKARTKPLYVLISKGQAERLKKMAAELEQSQSDIVKEALTVFLNQLDRRLKESKGEYKVDKAMGK